MGSRRLARLLVERLLAGKVAWAHVDPPGCHENLVQLFVVTTLPTLQNIGMGTLTTVRLSTVWLPLPTLPRICPNIPRE